MPETTLTKEASSAPAVAIAGLDHVVLVVADLARAIAFYERVLGCRVERTLEKPRLVQLRAGASLIDLIPSPPPPFPPPLAGEGREGGGPHEAAGQRRNMDHFALRLQSFDGAALAAHLQRQGVAVGEVHERYGAEGYGPSIYINDPDGNVVELKGPATRGL